MCKDNVRTKSHFLLLDVDNMTISANFIVANYLTIAIWYGASCRINETVETISWFWFWKVNVLTCKICVILFNWHALNYIDLWVNRNSQQCGKGLTSRKHVHLFQKSQWKSLINNNYSLKYSKFTERLTCFVWYISFKIVYLQWYASSAAFFCSGS